MLWLRHQAGHLALDFVNTVSWRNDPARRIERLDGPGALGRWTVARGLPEVGDAAAEDVARLRALREAIHAVLAPTAPGPLAPGQHPGVGFAPTAALEAAARDAVARATLDVGTGRWVADPATPAGLHDHLALVALDLLATADTTRLRRCADHDCGWLFHDTSRSGTRTWCSSGCGNRTRARRHRRKAPA